MASLSLYVLFVISLSLSLSVCLSLSLSLSFHLVVQYVCSDVLVKPDHLTAAACLAAIHSQQEGSYNVIIKHRTTYGVSWKRQCHDQCDDMVWSRENEPTLKHSKCKTVLSAPHQRGFEQ